MKYPAADPALAPIIVIDDDEDDLELMQDGLTTLGSKYPIMAFKKPLSAIECLTKEGTTAHFIICDIYMPLMTGYDLRKAMLTKDRPINHRPFFVRSTLLTDREISTHAELKIHQHYNKPVTQVELIETIRQMLAFAQSFNS